MSLYFPATGEENTEHGPEWVEALSLLRTAGGWNRERFDLNWVETMVRRFAEQHPNHLSEWLTPRQWMRVLLRRVKPNDPAQPRWPENQVNRFLQQSDNRIGSENRWGIISRTTKRRWYLVGEYSITRIPPPFDYAAEYERLGVQKRRVVNR